MPNKNTATLFRETLNKLGRARIEDMKRIDIGINLMNNQFKDREEIVSDSMKSLVGMIITGCDIKSNSEAIEFCRKMDTKNWEVCCTAGMHPHNAKNWNDNTKNELLNQLNSKYVIALGEAGLDFNRNYSTRSEQLACFEDILNIADTIDKPLFLHERDADTEFLKLMKKHREVCNRSVVHCFYGTKEDAMRYINLGMFIGITAIVTNPKRNKELIEAIKIIPLSRIMVETDGPYMVPYQLNGLVKKSIPDYTKYVIGEISKIKGITYSDVAHEIFNNTLKFFQL